jgi:piezo-type mechanosensitive ion channel component 1/2
LRVADDDDANYRNVSLRLHSTEPDNLNETSPTVQFWWEVKEDCLDANYNKKFKDMPFNDCNDHMVIYLFNDKLFPSTLSSLAAGG